MTDQLTLKLSTPGQLVARVLPYLPGSIQGAGGLVVTVSGSVYTVAPQSGSVVSATTGNTWTALQTFTAGIAVNTNISLSTTGLQQGLTTTQTPSGAASNPSWNLFNISPDTVDAGAGFSNGVAIIHGFGGSTVKGGRQALTVTAALKAATNSANRNRNHVAGNFIGKAATSDGGGVGTEKGMIFGLGSTGWLTGSATNIAQVKSYEADT